VEINGQMRYNQIFNRDVDPDLLRQIAEDTGGHFFRAEDRDTIKKAFDAIDHAQKIEFQAKSYLVTTELFWWLAVPGVIAVLIAAAAATPVGRKQAYA
jgi:Ca-activated chloride channel homolog